MKDRKRLQVIISSVAFAVVLIVAGVICIILHDKKTHKVATSETTSTVTEENSTETETITSELIETEIPVDVEPETEEVPTEEVIDDTYYITVNRTQNIVIVYQQDDQGAYQPLKAMICSVGLNGKTPVGEYRTSVKWRWAALNGSVYGQYVTRFKGPYLFHSVPYYNSECDQLESEEYNKLGEPASLGCVRLKAEDCKWIYDTIPAGTKVVVYDSEQPEPLARPTAVKLDLTSPYKGWDPTDPDPKNPWVKTPPVFSVKDMTVVNNTIKVEKGEKFVASEMITAMNFRGDAVPVTLTGEVNVFEPGTYTVNCSATDTYGNAGTASFSVVVADTIAPTATVINANLKIPFDKCKDINTLTEYVKANVEATDPGSEKSQLTITITNTNALSSFYNKAKDNKEASATISFYVTDASNNKSKTDSMNISYNPSTPSISAAEQIKISENLSGKTEEEILRFLSEKIQAVCATSPVDYSCTVVVTKNDKFTDLYTSITNKQSNAFTITYTVSIASPAVSEVKTIEIIYDIN